jgi:hypothetical protein
MSELLETACGKAATTANPFPEIMETLFLPVDRCVLTHCDSSRSEALTGPEHTVEEEIQDYHTLLKTTKGYKNQPQVIQAAPREAAVFNRTQLKFVELLKQASLTYSLRRNNNRANVTFTRKTVFKIRTSGLQVSRGRKKRVSLQ